MKTKLSFLTKNWPKTAKIFKVLFLICLFSSVLLAPKLKHLDTQYSVTQFMPENHPLIQQHEKVLEDFLIDKFSPMIVEINTPGESWLSKDKMDRLRKLTQAIAELAEVDSARSLATVESSAESGGDIAMGGLMELTDESSWNSRVISDPTLYPLLISKNLDAVVISVQTGMARSELLQLMDSIRSQAQTSFPSAEVSIGGIPAMQAQMSHLIGQELKLFLALALFAACLSLLLVFRDIFSILLPFFAVAISCLLTLEWMVLCGLSFNALSATVTVLVTVIVVAMSIHSQLRYFEESLHQEKNEALVSTFVALFLPNFLTAATTAVGFATLLISDAPLIREYGFAVASGVLIAWFVTTLFLFGFLERWPRAKPRKWVGASPGFLAKLVDYRPWPVVVVMILALIGLILGSFLSWDGKLFDDLPKHHESRRVTEFVDKNLGGVVDFNLVLHAKEEGFWVEPSHLRKVDELEKEWRHKEGVGSVISMPELLRQSANDPFWTIPKERGQIAERVFMFSLGETNPMQTYLSPDQKSLRIAIRLQDLPANQLQYTTQEMTKELGGVFPDLQIQKGGVASYVHELNRYLSLALMNGFWWAMLAISILLLFIFRSLTWTLIAAIPNFLPAMGLLGLLGWLQQPIKPAIAIIFSIALGIAFDNTVYILTRIRSYNEGVGQKFVKKAILEEGLSCFISSICLFSGFAIFLMSYFSINRYFGLFLLFSIMIGLIGDLLFLPSLMASLPQAIIKRLK
ncbi:MAG: MMPL family transporter [Bdellovibrionales bacterium]|nr:MMPL family transporter [Bdellovibrionales bacterium]